jgi:hypothetical protein
MKKAAQSAFNLQKNPSLLVFLVYLQMLVIGSAVLYAGNMFFPEQIVLGTMSMDSNWAILHSMGTLALVLTFAMPFFQISESFLGRKLTPVDWMVGYFVVNFGALWAITRFSDQFGLGVASWMVIAALAFVLDMIQGFAMMQFGKMTGTDK